MDKEAEIQSKGVAAALKLLDRAPDPAYIHQWTELLAEAKSPERPQGITAVVFRLGKEWLAISCKCFIEVISDRPVHRIPHRTNENLRGLVNYQGQLTLCVDMHHFLEVEPLGATHDHKSPPHTQFSRMVAIEKDHEIWIFAVDDVAGVTTFDLATMSNIPVTLSRSTSNFLRGVIEWKNKDVGYLDEELLFFGLKRKLL